VFKKNLAQNIFFFGICLANTVIYLSSFLFSLDSSFVIFFLFFLISIWIHGKHLGVGVQEDQKDLQTWMNYGRLQNSKQGACKLFFIFPYLIWLLVSLSRYHMFILACIRSSLTNNRVVFFSSSTIRMTFSSTFVAGFQ
jgi:hypothetical protein